MGWATRTWKPGIDMIVVDRDSDTSSTVHTRKAVASRYDVREKAQVRLDCRRGVSSRSIDSQILRNRNPPLLVVLVGLVVDHVEESQLVHALRRRNHAQPVPELLLLEVLLRPVAARTHAFVSTRSEEKASSGQDRHHERTRRQPSETSEHSKPRARRRLEEDVDSQVLEVAPGELLVRNDLDLALALLADLDRLAEVIGAAVDLDPVVQELLKSRDVEDLVRCRLRRVDDELFANSASLSCRAQGVPDPIVALVPDAHPEGNVPSW